MNNQSFGNKDFTNKVPVYADINQETPIDEPVDTIEGTIIQDVPMGSSIPYDTVAGEAIIQPPLSGANILLSIALLSGEESELLRARWNEIQGRFVDEPRSAVQQADALVSDVTEKISQMFANEHSALEYQWKQGNDVSTEELRQALQRYRSFFNRLVA